MEANQVLPLENPPRHLRRYDFAAAMTSRQTMQLRASLMDQQYLNTDAETEKAQNTLKQALSIHEMVVLWEIHPREKTVIDCKIAMPLGASSFCQKIGIHGSELIGLKIDNDFEAKVRSIYAGTAGCTHINSLLIASVAAIYQSLNFCFSFEKSNQIMTSQNHKKILARMSQAAADSCFGWQRNGNFLNQTLAGDNSELLKNVNPLLHSQVYPPKP